MRTRSRSSQGDDAGGADSVSGVSEQPDAGPSQEALSGRRSTRSRRSTAQQLDVGAEQLPAISEEPFSEMTPRPRRQSRSSASQIQAEAVPTPVPRKSAGRRRQQQQHTIEEQQQAESQSEEQQMQEVEQQQPQEDGRQQQLKCQQEGQQQQQQQQQKGADVFMHDGATTSLQQESEGSEDEEPHSLQHPAGHLNQQAAAATSSKAAAHSKHPSALFDSASDSDWDDGDMDSDAMLERLAASIGAAFGGEAAAGPSLQQQDEDEEEAATAARAAANDNGKSQLAWRPDTGLRSSTTPGAAAASTSAAAGSRQLGEQLPGKEKGLAGQLRVLPRDAVRAAREARKAAPDTAGAKWYGLPATKIDDDMKRDLRLLRLRGAYDPKRFYKSFDKGKFPKYFQVGTVVNDPLDFYGGRLTKAERKTTLTEQLLADTGLTSTRKKRYSKLQVEAQKYVKVKKRKTDLPRNKSPHHKPKH